MAPTINNTPCSSHEHEDDEMKMMAAAMMMPTTLRRRWTHCDTDDDDDEFSLKSSRSCPTPSCSSSSSTDGSRRTSLTFASRVYDEPIPGPPAMPVRKRSSNGLFDEDSDDEDDESVLQAATSFAAMSMALHHNTQGGIDCAPSPALNMKKRLSGTRFGCSVRRSSGARGGGILKKSSKFSS